MKKIGLALSGGGFRATLYHLGLVRFLRDSNLLSNVTHITSVSGGSVFAAHLALNWGRYTGSVSEFEAAANELLNFVQLDIRNRIVRRVPFCVAMHLPRRLLGLSNRKLSRTGLLEDHYEKHLYGDTSLFELPENPQLHILSTNLSEGCLCSFSRNGLLVMRRNRSSNNLRVDQTHAGLATVAMAVTASSAFPAFFPPLVVSETDIGTSGDFGRQSFTDGGIFDNLGVRMFHYLEEMHATDKSTPDCVLISDVGKRISVKSQQERSGGAIRTGIRASDILMDRVWQLETDKFTGTPGFIFARAVDIVEESEDPTALHPEIQRQLPTVRTDFDRFSSVEISSLVRHGYCVGRKVCKAHPELFGNEFPAGAPWDPCAKDRGTSTLTNRVPESKGPNLVPTTTTAEARTLQKSSERRIWSTLLDYRDWVSYIYIPIIVPLLFLLPYFVVKSYQRSYRINQIVESLAQSSQDLDKMSQLVEGPVEPWTGEMAEELHGNGAISDKGFTLLQDSRIIDLRKWKPTPSSDTYLYGYRRLKVLKHSDNLDNNLFRISVLASSAKTQVRFPQQLLHPTLHSRSIPAEKESERKVHWEVQADFTKVSPGDSVDIIYEHISPGLFVREQAGAATLSFDVEVQTVELNRWLLLPEGAEFRDYRLIRYEMGKPETSEEVKVVTRYLAEDFSILAFKLLDLKPGYTYELTWYYKQ